MLSSSETRTDTTTRVLFPRFEIESPASAPIHKRELIRLAQPKPWLTGVELERVLDPEVVVSVISNRDVRGKWWGVFHRASVAVTPTQTFESPISGEPTAFRSQRIKHTYLWDHQAMEGEAIEVVLEKVVQDEPNDVVMAMLVDSKWLRSRKTEPLQRLMMHGENGIWCQPRIDRPNETRDFYLQVLGELSVVSDNS